jgi:hypothetical protein
VRFSQNELNTAKNNEPPSKPMNDLFVIVQILNGPDFIACPNHPNV